MTPPVLTDPERQAIVDGEHLKLLRIFHFVIGGLRIAFSSIFILHVVLFGTFGSGVIPFDQTGGPHGAEAPPLWVFRILSGVFGLFMLFGWTSGILTIVSGFKIGRSRARVFSLAVAALNCLSLPFGTVLGVFTIVVLSRDSVQRRYSATGAVVSPAS